MNKNPFSLFDFLGYLFPGALSVIIIYYLANDCTLSCKTLEFSLENICIYTIISYTLGHLISYVSATIVENYANWRYDYPSNYLLKENNKKYFSYNKEQTTKKRLIVGKYFIKVLVGTFLLPIVIIDLVSRIFINPKEFLARTLDNTLSKTIQDKRDRLLEVLKITHTEDNNDVERIIYHYEYERIQNHRNKIDNYVALYGFLRSITLILNCTFLYLLFIALRSMNFDADFNIPLIFAIVITGCGTYLFFAAFMKFYRRYMLEIYMCLVTDETFIHEI